MNIQPPIHRLMSRIEVTSSGCWQWMGKRKANGYGQFMINRKYIHVHRFSYEYHKGHIPNGLTIDHLCRNRACVNPDHLEAVTHRVNVLRGTSFSAERARQTHCHNGHSFDDDNTYIKPNGTRNCRKCKCDAQKKYQESKVK